MACLLQVSLAAETCGHVHFTTHTDTWYNSEPLHCGDIEPGDVSFWDVYNKVRTPATSTCSLSQPCSICPQAEVQCGL